MAKMTIPDSGKTYIDVCALCGECVWPFGETVQLGHRPGSGANPLSSSLPHFISDYHWCRLRKRNKTINMQQRHLHLCLLVFGGGLLSCDPQLYSQVSPCQVKMGQLNPGIQHYFPYANVALTNCYQIFQQSELWFSELPIGEKTIRPCESAWKYMHKTDVKTLVTFCRCCTPVWKKSQLEKSFCVQCNLLLTLCTYTRSFL